MTRKGGNVKARIEFTLNIPKSSLAALKELSAAEDPGGIRDFLRMDVTQYIVDYLTSNGIEVTVEREKIA